MDLSFEERQGHTEIEARYVILFCFVLFFSILTRNPNDSDRYAVNQGASLPRKLCE